MASQIYIFFLLLNFQVINPSISLVVTGFGSSKGKAMVLLLDQNEKEISKQIISIQNNQAVYTFNNLNLGKYAIKVFHDENSNQKLDTNIMGIPKEKWGVSNNIAAKFGPPNFKKMLFDVKSETKIQIRLN